MRVAIVGSGPSGFYAAMGWFKKDPTVQVDILDRLPTPYGLVRGGVAPDHQKIKSVVRAYAKLSTNPGFRFFGNVELGRDVSIDALLANYDQVILAVGSQSSRTLGIPGESLPGCHSATSFVAWYNGHPDFQNHSFNTDVSDVVVVGVGNVAMDVTRMLVASDSHLAPTDMPDSIRQQLAGFRRERIHVLGRRGPAQAAFTPKEIAEIDALEGVSVRVRPSEAELDPASRASLEGPDSRQAQKNVAFVESHQGMEAPEGDAGVWLRFCTSPVAILGEDKVEAVRVEKTTLVERNGRLSPIGTGEFEEIPTGMVLTAVGYRSVPIPGVPFDDRTGRFPNEEGQIVGEDGPVPGLYVVGWAKRGPSGLIGTNRADSFATVERMTQEVRSVDADPGWLPSRCSEAVRWEGWKTLDELELARGAAKGKVREKFTSIDEMLAALKSGV